MQALKQRSGEAKSAFETSSTTTESTMQMTGFEVAEYEARVRRAREILAQHDLSGFLLCDENNYKYFTGHRTQFFVSKSRPMYVVVPRDGQPIALVTEIESTVIRQ